MKSTVGLRGELPFIKDGWDYDVWFTYGRSTLDEVTRNQVNVAKLQTALNPVACRRDTACPKDSQGNPTLDIFGRGAKSRAEIDYVLFDDEEATRYEMWHLAGAVTGELWNFPGGPINVAARLEWRHESGSVQQSATVQAGHSGGNYAEPTQGDFSVWEFFAEFHAPLIADRAATPNSNRKHPTAIPWGWYGRRMKSTTYHSVSTITTCKWMTPSIRPTRWM